MRTARQSAIRLLQLMMVASIVLSAVLFAFAAWLNYRHTRMVADERIERSLDILHEHSLKVFQTVERAIAEVDEVLRGLSDEQIRAQEQRLNARFRQIVAAMPQLQAIVVIDRNGRRLVASMVYPVSQDQDLADRSYFRAQVERDAGTFVSEVLTPRSPSVGTYFFNLSRRRAAPDGSFNGVTAIAVAGYFDDFYARIGHSTGSLYAIAREDGISGPLSRARRPGAIWMRAVRCAGDRGARSLYGAIPDRRCQRRIGYRKLIGFPVYVLAGTDIGDPTEGSTLASHLIFGLPATFLMFSISGLRPARRRSMTKPSGGSRRVAPARRTAWRQSGS